MPGVEGLSWVLLVYIAFAIACAGLVHGTLGLGFPLVATPLISLATDIKTAIVLVVAPTLAVVIAAILNGGGFRRTLYDWWRMPIWMFAGALVGTSLFVTIDPAPLTLLLALAILIWLALDWFGRSQLGLLQRHPTVSGMVFGFLGGVFEGSVNIAAPPLLIYFLSLGLTPAALVKALNLCFFTGKTTQITTLALTTEIAPAVWLSTVPLCAIGIVTSLAGARIRNRVDARTYRRWLKQALLAMAALLIGQFALMTRAG